MMVFSRDFENKKENMSPMVYSSNNEFIHIMCLQNFWLSIVQSMGKVGNSEFAGIYTVQNS